MKNSLSLFQNVKFNVWLLAVIAAASLLGTLIPQVTEVPEKVQAFMAQSPKLGALFQTLDIFNLYYSWWYCGLLGLLAFDVIVCKLIFVKFPGFHTFQDEEWQDSILEKCDYKRNFQIPGSLQGNLQKIVTGLKNQYYSVQLRNSNQAESVTILAARHRLQRYGSWVSHVSILAILAANLTGALYGFKEVVTLPEGTSSKMQHRPWTVTCDQFTVDWYKDSSVPKTFSSDLRLFEAGRLAEERKVIVNQPLEYKRVRFYQASYGPYLKEAQIGFFLRKDPKRSPKVRVQLDEDVSVPGTPYSLRILQFVPDFSLTEKKEVVSRSPHPQNPALQVLVSKGGKPLIAPWVFEKFPGLQMPPVQKEDEFILVLADYVPSYYTGLQVAYDPGADFFWIGCSILVLGLAALFYLNQRKLYLFLKSGVSGLSTEIRVGGFSSRGAAFENEFGKIAHSIETV
ncbi:MAG: cytochrome c biogenesis protein ResB [Elusimicrobia bacterium]|nr:cytochrome c biogenesis protein ResB [Elusimicrobiota bacterium]